MQEYIITMPRRVSTDKIAELKEIIHTVLETAAQEDCVVFDADHMEYISSAGLREIHTIKKRYPNTKVVNCSTEVYDIFNTTGFVDMISIEKKMRYVDVEHLELIGHGAQGKVYLFEDGWIVKAYSPNITIETIKNEANLARYLFSIGFPTAIPFDLIRHKDGYGIVYEMIADGSLSECVHKGKITIDKVADVMTELFHQIHSLEDDKQLLPGTKEMFLTAIEEVGRRFFHEEEIKSLKRLVDAIGDGNTIIHGDFQPKNIVVSNDEYFAIDIGEVSRGNVIFDYISTYLVMISAIEMDQGLSLFLGLEPEELSKLWDGIKKNNIIKGKNAEESAAAIRLLDKLSWLNMFCILVGHNLPEEAVEKFPQSVREKLLSDIDGTIEELKRLEHCFGK